MASTATTDKPAAPQKGADQRDRKSQVLTHHTASQVRSIADAVVIKDGEPFFLCPPDGQVPVTGAHGFGLYHHDTRYLAGYELRIAEETPNALAATAVRADRMELELAMPAIDLGDGRRIGQEQLAVHWTRRLDGEAVRLHDRLVLRSHDRDAARLPLQLAFRADFADVFAIRGLLDDRPGATHEPAWDGDVLRFAYDGRDGVDRFLDVTITGATIRRRHGPSCEVTVDVGGRDSAAIEIVMAVREHLQPGAPPIERRTSGRQRRDEAKAANEEPQWSLRLDSDGLALNAVVDRSLEDLLTLRSKLDDRAYYAAGVPWFSTLFGRDSLISAYQTLAFDAAVAADTLRLLANRQGTKDDDYRDEEPGKILHELRIGELARLGEVPHSPYYGTIDATPLFLVLLARHAMWTGSLEVFQELRDPVDRALDWIDRTIEAAGGGRYLAYDSTTTHGLVNQGWKDSGNAIVTADGSIAEPPIALAEVQGYVFAAWRGIADLLDRSSDESRAGALRKRAEELRARFEDDFWSDSLGCYVLALARDGKPCDVIASNAGQVLWTGIAAPDRAATVTERLLRDDMFSGWGIRTLSDTSVAANPIGYHLGTVWPHDNGLIVEGFRRYGQHEAAERVLRGLLEASTDFPQQRLPECFAGFARDEFGIPVRYPVACHPQAWAAGTFPHLVTTALGLVPDGFARQLRIVEPRLPEFLEHLTLTGLRVADARVDLRFRRAGSVTRVEVGKVDGDLRVDVVEDDDRRGDDRDA
jgi:glycogen debranching enzyme